jgi:hypothetical protein
MKKLILAAVILLDAAIVVYLAGGVAGAALFAVFVGAFLLPACVLAMRLPHLREMPAGLRLTAASVLVVIAIVPWFFVRKFLPVTIADVVTCAVLVAAAAKFGRLRATLGELGPELKRSRFVVLLVLPVLFALVWLGYGARVGNDVMFHGLFAIDFGNLVSIVSTVRASPLLPLAHVTDSGPLNYHWLYFTLPAMLTDFCGGAVPAFNALILVNLLTAALLVHTLVTLVAVLDPEGDRRTAQAAMAVALFAPFTIYYYQTIDARLHLGWLAVPTRNHLLLSPLNSMIVFGNNTFALVLALFTAMQVERWNRERRMTDLVLGTAALSTVIGYSVTLLFPLVAALLLWLALGRIARPLLVLAWAVIMGGAAAAMFLAIHVLSSGDSRHIVLAFDRGQFLRMVIFGLLPLWGLLALSGKAGTLFNREAGTLFNREPFSPAVSGGGEGADRRMRGQAGWVSTSCSADRPPHPASPPSPPARSRGGRRTLDERAWQSIQAERGKYGLTFFHMLIVAAIAIPSFLYIAGSSTGQVDFSIKTGSLLAVAFAPLIAVTIERWFRGSLARWQSIAAVGLVALGAIQTSAYILQFPYYRLRHSESRGVAIPGDYYRALIWIRDQTPRRAIVAEPGGLTVKGELPSTWIAERRAWLPTPYTESILVPPPGSAVWNRVALWAAFMREPGDAAVAGIIAREADYLVLPRDVRSPFWTPVRRSGSWVIYRSTARAGR